MTPSESDIVMYKGDEFIVLKIDDKSAVIHEFSHDHLFLDMKGAFWMEEPEFEPAGKKYGRNLFNLLGWKKGRTA